MLKIKMLHLMTQFTVEYNSIAYSSRLMAEKYVAIMALTISMNKAIQKIIKETAIEQTKKNKN